MKSVFLMACVCHLRAKDLDLEIRWLYWCMLLCVLAIWKQTVLWQENQQIKKFVLGVMIADWLEFLRGVDKIGFFKYPRQRKMLQCVDSEVHQMPSTIIGTLSEYEQNRLWKNMSAVYPLCLSLITSYYFIEVKLFKK